MSLYRLDSVPKPRFEIGAKVFVANVSQTKGQHPCPDCLGTREWKVITATGHEMTTACMRCGSNTLRDFPSLDFQKFVAGTRELTIGAVRIDTASYDGKYISYMCDETGVGSGSIYYEDDVYPTQEQAMAIAEARAARMQLESDSLPSAVKAKSLSYLSLQDARFKIMHDVIWSSWYHLNCVIDDVKEVAEKHSDLSWDVRFDIKNSISDYHTENHPMGKIINLLREGKAAEVLAMIPCQSTPEADVSI